MYYKKDHNIRTKKNTNIIYILLLISTLSIVEINASYSYITVTAPASIAGNYGCMPTLFGATSAKDGQLTSTLKIPEKMSLSDDFQNNNEDGCPVFNENGEKVSPLLTTDLTGSTVLLSLSVVNGRFKCSSLTQVQNAIDGNAAGVIFTNVFTNTIPRTVGYSYVQTPVEIPVCTITKETEAILRGATDVITIDWSKYTGWISSLEPMPPHRETPIEILSPWELKWTYPAAMASFNPDEVAPVSAEIIVPKWHKSCASFYSIASCQNCYNLASPFENSDVELNGKIFLFIEYPACFENYHHYPYMTQQHGGVAAIMKNPNGDNLPASVGPYAVGIDLNIATYIMKSSQIEYVYYILKGGKKVDQSKMPEVHVSLPRITNGWGPNFTPHEDDLESIPDTTLTFTPNAAGSQASSCNGGSYAAGQTTYNPETMAESSVALMIGVVDSSCKIKISQESAGEGVDCATCLNKINDGSVFANGDAFNGKVIIIKADDIYCAHEFIDVTKVVQDKGGEGLVISMRDEFTMTLVAGSGISQNLRDGITIPTYNIRKKDGEEISTKLETCNAAGGSINAVLPKLESGKASARAPHAIATAISATQVIINSPHHDSVVDAGQAYFNPKTSKRIQASMRKIYLASVCNAKRSCQACYLLDSPIQNRGGLHEAVAVLELEGASCIRPVYNYVLFAQRMGAIAVIFVTEGNHTLTLGPEASNGDDIQIPSFSVSKRAFEDAGGDTLFYTGTVTLPALYDHVAPETTVQAKSQMIVNKEGDVPDEDVPPVDPNNKIVNGGIGLPLTIGLIVSGIILCFCIGKRVRLIHRRNKMIAFGGMTHETTTQTQDFSNIFEDDHNMFDNISLDDHIKNGAKVMKSSGRMSRVRMKKMSQPPPPLNPAPNQKKKGDSNMKSFDIESGTMKRSSGTVGGNISVSVPSQPPPSSRRHTIATSPFIGNGDVVTHDVGT